MGGKLIVVAGGQYGSEAKGHVSAMLLESSANRGKRVFGVRVGGPNAGHVVYGKCPPWCSGGSAAPTEGDELPGYATLKGGARWGNEPEADHWFEVGGMNRYAGHPWKLRQVPVAAVANLGAGLVIAAGSEVYAPTLEEELYALDAAGYQASDRILVDSSATMLTEDHIETEKHSDLVERLGSTAKGIGAARAARIWRTAGTWGVRRFAVDDAARYLRNRLETGATVLIEGTQGYGLGLHQPAYPQVTSGDCRAIDFLAQAGLSPWHESVGSFELWVVLRVRPIRVAGNSGPMKEETSWQALGLKEERTTVTKKVRRVGGWDPELARAAIEANGGQKARVALSMVDTQVPGVAGMNSVRGLAEETSVELHRFLTDIEKDLGHIVSWIGTGPDSGFWT